MSRKDAERKLTEDDCLTSSQQYDPQLIFYVPLRRKGYQAIDASAFVRCGGLRVVDISGNRLSTLSGLESVAPQLTFLNAAENSLHDIGALVTCAALERCMLEGNKLASVDSLQPLVSLPCLAELVLQRHVPLDDAAIGSGSPEQSSDKLLLLDNPVCRDAVAYREHFLAKMSHVRWVDGVSTYLRASSLAESTTTESHDAKENSTKAIVDAAIRSFQSIRVQMTATVSEETTLRHQLERAADRCKPSTVTVAARTP
ncbi:leucine-rich_repeat_protein_(LRRP)_-_putative [Leishmania major strain Friedlin]|nr:leucine-rich_repeat_protein_(LRRP)_-_putative [Leishmania major strain Friedlin]